MDKRWQPMRKSSTDLPSDCFQITEQQGSIIQVNTRTRQRQDHRLLLIAQGLRSDGNPLHSVTLRTNILQRARKALRISLREVRPVST